MILIMKNYLNYNVNLYLKKNTIKQKKNYKIYQIIRIYYNYIAKQKTSPKCVTPTNIILQILQTEHHYKSNFQNNMLNKWFNFKLCVISNNVNKFFT